MDGLWATKSECVGLIAHAIIFQAFQPMWAWSTNVTDGQTDRRTTCDRNTALCTLHCSASRGKNGDMQQWNNWSPLYVCATVHGRVSWLVWGACMGGLWTHFFDFYSSSEAERLAGKLDSSFIGQLLKLAMLFYPGWNSVTEFNQSKWVLRYIYAVFAAALAAARPCAGTLGNKCLLGYHLTSLSIIYKKSKRLSP